MSDSSSDAEPMTPPDISETASKMKDNLLPQKSRRKYEKCYQDFMNWKITKNTTSFSENVLLVYFQELSDKLKSSSLWNKYSMLKSTLNIKHEIDITKYTKLLSTLRRKSVGYKGKKSQTFLAEEIKKFLSKAPDRTYLLTKIALIFGIMGACSRQELYSIKFKNVKVLKNKISVKVYNTKTNTYRYFTLTGSHYELCQKYINLRPEDCKTPHFFIHYRTGKCTACTLGRNKFGILGKVIATYLQLPNPELYTGHCFRRTSLKLFVDAGGDIKTMERLGWKSTPGSKDLVASIRSKFQQTTFRDYVYYTKIKKLYSGYRKMTHDGADSYDSDLNDASKTIGESDVEISEEETDNAEESDTTDPIALPERLTKRVSVNIIDNGANKKPRHDIDNIEIDYDNIDKFGEQIAFLLKRIPKKLCRELQESIVTLVKTATKNHDSKTKRDALPSTSSKTIVSDVFSKILLTPTLAIKPDPNEEITIKEEPLYRSDENNISIDETTQSIQTQTQKIQLDQRFTSTIKTFPKPMTVPIELVGTLDCVKKEILDPGESSNNTIKYKNNEENYFRKTLSEPSETLVKIEMVESDANSEAASALTGA